MKLCCIYIVYFFDTQLNTFSDIKNIIHDFFFTGETELKLSHLVSVRQKSKELEDLETLDINAIV
jgi:hypothetical protein